MDGARTWIQSVLDSESQHGRLLTMEFPRGDGPEYAVLLVNTLHAREELSRSFRYEVELLSDDAHIALADMMAKMATISLVRNDGTLRHFNGYVTEFRLVGADGGLARYRMVLEPWMAFTRLRQDCVSFHGRTLQQITELTLRHCLQHDWQTRLFHDDPPVTCINQYNETDYNHLHRRWEALGWHYWYEHRADGHTLWLGDDTMMADAIDAREGTFAPEGMPFRSEAGSQEDDSIHQWQAVRRIGASVLTLSTFDYKNPSPQRISARCRHPQGDLFDHEVHEYAGARAYKGSREGEPLAQRRSDGREAMYQYFEASGNDRSAQPGRYFKLEEHFSAEAPVKEIGEASREGRRYLVLSVEHSASNNYQDGRHAQSHYTNRFTCIRQERRWFPERGHHSRPCPDPGVQTAIVVGPEGEEIHTDGMGRIKVQFHWDRQGTGSGGNSPWVRVAMPVAGSGFGQIGLPRVGQEVVVQFMNGNVDHPIVTGVVYNGEHAAPWELDQQKALSGWRSREMGGGGRSNQLRMDDTASQISAQLGSDHGNSVLNLGYLTEPRSGGLGSPRGEGAELRSNQAVALQGAQGVLINAGDRGGQLLAREGLVNAAKTLEGLSIELDSLATQHDGECAEGDSLQALVGKTEEWDVGTNVSRKTTVQFGGGAPIVAANGEAGAIVTSANSVLVGSQKRVDVASAGDVQASAGRSLFIRAVGALQIFAAKLGIKLIAGSGNIRIAAHDGEVVITALKRIRLVSNESVILEAPALQFIAQGARSDYGDGKITHQGSGTYTVKHSEFHYLAAGDSTPEELKLPTTKITHDQQVLIRDLISRQPLVQRRYRITVEDGCVFEGTTDENGMTQRFSSDIAFAQYKIELLDDGET